MFSSFSLPLTSLLRPSNSSWKTREIPVPPVKVHATETAREKSARTLKHLLKANHTNHSILWHDNMFHNHAPHILGSVYILGGTHDQLTKIYESEEKDNEPWKDSPGEISKEDWRDFLGKAEYQRAYVDFFEDQLVANGYDWKVLLPKFMYEGEKPLINSVISGVGHPLIHLAYGIELDSGTVAIEGMAMAACCYNKLHQYTDDPSYTKPGSFKSKSTLDILRKVHKDSRLKGNDKGAAEIEKTADKHESILLDYWNAWDVGSDPFKRFEDSQRTAAAMLMATDLPDGKYDFFKVHVLTTSHAVRILLPVIPAKFQLPLVRQWWLLALMTYIGQGRPAIEVKKVEKYPAKSWDEAEKLALESKWCLDAHYVKGIRALKVASETWGDSDSFYLKAATKLSVEFGGWGGFGSAGGG